MTVSVDRILQEGAIGLAGAAKILGTIRVGKQVHPSTLSRWCLGGIHLPSGEVLRLEHIRVSGRICTSRAALIRFLERQNEPSRDTPTRSPAERSRAADAAAVALAADGA